MVRRRSRSASIRVTIIPLGGEVKEVALSDNATVKEAIEAAGYSTGTEVRDKNGDVVEMDSNVEDGDELTLLSEGKVEGGK